MKYVIAWLSVFLSAQAFADRRFEAEVNLSQDKAAQGRGLLKWRVPVEGMIYRWGPSVIFGIAENSRLRDNGSVAAENYYAAGAGLSIVVTTPSSPIALFNDLGFLADGIELSTASGDNARHSVFLLNSGIRLEDSIGTFVQMGISIADRDLPKGKDIRVNDLRLTKYSVSPLLGLGIHF
ncbi:MAG: hypothetical protein EBR09_09600 [Proteobacteria bacterium]|nr:hypothetical protein [Pseudomonadota bacterium]